MEQNIKVTNKIITIMYWNIGRIILDNSEWGNKFIDNISADLKLEFPQTTRFFSQKFEIYDKFTKLFDDFTFFT